MPASTYFDRQVELNVGTKGIRGLRVRFSVEMTPDGKADTAKVTVWNANKDTRAQWQAPDESSYVVLKAGYGKDISQVFAGDSRTVVSRKQGPEWVTDITAGDGERSIQRNQTQETYKKGTSAKDILLRLLDKVEGIDVTEAKKVVQDKGFREGIQSFYSSKTISGPLFAEIETMMAGFGLEWAVQDGKLRAVPRGQTIDLPTIPLIKPGTGLVGSPEAGEKGRITLTTLLDTRLKPYHKFELQSESFNGLYRAGKVTFSGDTHGREFYTKLEATPVK